MPQSYTDKIGETDREELNDSVKGNGPLTANEYRSLSVYYGVTVETVRRWFSIATTQGIIPLSYVGLRICALFDGRERRRLLTGAVFTIDGGLEREPLYTGTPKLTRFPVGAATGNTTPDENGNIEPSGLAKAVDVVGEVIDGYLDNESGFRLSKAWLNIYVTKERVGWLVTVRYGTLAPEDDSDPAEPCGDEDTEEPGDGELI